MTWKAGPIHASYRWAFDPVQVNGYTYRGLGLHRGPDASKLEHPPLWAITHLATGHKVMELVGYIGEVKPWATRIAELTDWTFTSVEGWRNQDPDLPARFVALLAEMPREVRGTYDPMNPPNPPCPERGREVLRQRDGMDAL